MKLTQRFLKRFFDLLFSVLGLILFGWAIIIVWIIATIDTGENGIFTQERVGLNGRLFKVIKIRTMRGLPEFDTTVTTNKDPRITILGKTIRRLKVDEFPQLINVFLGQMSFVGPRPDVAGFADKLPESDRKIILSVRPGITGPATLKYRREEELLANVEVPEVYNREVVFPDKVSINRKYIENYCLWDDFKYVWRTIFKSPEKEL